MKVLISCYACSPTRGSEPGMGWNFVSRIANFAETHVIVEKVKWKNELEKHLEDHPELKDKLKFYFIPKERNKTLRKIYPPSYYWYYKSWQKKAYKLAKELNEIENFDLIHQLNMVGFREPGYLWKIDKPYVWGPIGGLENTETNLLHFLSFKGKLHFGFRNIYNNYQKKYLKRPKKAANRDNSILISATINNQKEILRLWRRKTSVMTEVGTSMADSLTVKPNKRQDTNPLEIIWSGLHIQRKALHILLEALSKINIPFRLHILGEGPETKEWKLKAKNYGIYENCIWYGWLNISDVKKIYSIGHLFCITSIYDLTSTVTLEALSHGLPIISLNHMGFSEVITNECGIKVPIDNSRRVISYYQESVQKLYKDEKLRSKLSLGAINRASEYNWDNKVDNLIAIYQNLLGGNEDSINTQ